MAIQKKFQTRKEVVALIERLMNGHKRILLPVIYMTCQKEYGVDFAYVDRIIQPYLDARWFSIKVEEGMKYLIREEKDALL